MASCLSHNMSLKGLFGPPRRLVTDATHRLCGAIQANSLNCPTRFVLMNTARNRNRDLDVAISLRERAVVGLLLLLLPPYVDIERAADQLRTGIGQNNQAINAVVRFRLKGPESDRGSGTLKQWQEQVYLEDIRSRTEGEDWTNGADTFN